MLSLQHRPALSECSFSHTLAISPSISSNILPAEETATDKLSRFIHSLYSTDVHFHFVDNDNILLKDNIKVYSINSDVPLTPRPLHPQLSVHSFIQRKTFGIFFSNDDENVKQYTLLSKLPRECRHLTDTGHSKAFSHFSTFLLENDVVALLNTEGGRIGFLLPIKQCNHTAQVIYFSENEINARKKLLQRQMEDSQRREEELSKDLRTQCEMLALLRKEPQCTTKNCIAIIVDNISQVPKDSIIEHFNQFGKVCLQTRGQANHMASLVMHRNAGMEAIRCLDGSKLLGMLIRVRLALYQVIRPDLAYQVLAASPNTYSNVSSITNSIDELEEGEIPDEGRIPDFILLS